MCDRCLHCALTVGALRLSRKQSSNQLARTKTAAAGTTPPWSMIWRRRSAAHASGGHRKWVVSRCLTLKTAFPPLFRMASLRIAAWLLLSQDPPSKQTLTLRRKPAKGTPEADAADMPLAAGLTSHGEARSMHCGSPPQVKSDTRGLVGRGASTEGQAHSGRVHPSHCTGGCRVDPRAGLLCVAAENAPLQQCSAAVRPYVLQ